MHIRTRLVALLTIVLVSFATGSPQVLASSAQTEPAGTEESEPTPTRSVNGSVVLNDLPAWEGVEISIIPAADPDSDVVCGSARTTSAGTYDIPISDACASGTAINIVLTQTTPPVSSQHQLPEGVDGRFTINPSFTLTEFELAGLPPRPLGDEDNEGAVGQALLRQSTSVFDEVERLLIWLLSAGALLLAFMALAMLLVTRRRYDFLSEAIADLSKSESGPEAWADVFNAESNNFQSRFQVFRWMVEGLVMSFVVIALIALGAAGKVEAQGIVSVLAAMVGYAAGRVIK